MTERECKTSNRTLGVDDFFQYITERECKTCNRTLGIDDFYRYVTGRLYAKCKKCHNKGRNNYARKRDHTNQAPSNPAILEVRNQNPGSAITTMMMQTPDGEMKYFAFDFINMACKALSSEGVETTRSVVSTTSGVQADVSSSNPQEVKVGSSGSSTST